MPKGGSLSKKERAAAAFQLRTPEAPAGARLGRKRRAAEDDEDMDVERTAAAAAGKRGGHAVDLATQMRSHAEEADGRLSTKAQRSATAQRPRGGASGALGPMDEEDGTHGGDDGEEDADVDAPPPARRTAAGLSSETVGRVAKLQRALAVDAAEELRREEKDRAAPARPLSGARKGWKELLSAEDAAVLEELEVGAAASSEDGGEASDDEDEDEDGEARYYDVEEEQLTEEDLRLLALWQPAAAATAPAPAKRSIADLIMESVARAEREQGVDLAEGAQKPLDGRVVRVYSVIGQLMSKYRSGRLPKPFNFVASMPARQWEEVLWLMQPDRWTPAATRQATRIFASNLSPRTAQRFYNLVLLPKVREDIRSNRKLNYHLYRALLKATFKPEAFFRGIVLPLADDPACSLREATIVASVVARVSLPPLHAAAAMLKIAQMPYSGANSIFLRTLVDKRFALPYRAVNGLVDHYYRFANDERALPVLWHQALLSFVQRYKNEFTSVQRRALFDLVKVQSHYLITAEIRRELESGKNRA